jgi:hypothetical protein
MARPAYGGPRAAQHGIHALQLVVGEWSRDEVVAATHERTHAVDGIRLRTADHDHGHTPMKASRERPGRRSVAAF